MEKNQSASKKIAIIGGGIIGLYLAWKLSEKDHQVQVFEKKKEIGKKECSGLVSERIFNFIPQARKLIKNQIEFILVHAPRRTFKINYQEKFYILEHEDLDREVAKLATAAGAEILLGREMNELPQGFDRIIGCDGYNSMVRKRLGIREPKFRLGIQGFSSARSAGVHSANYAAVWLVSHGFIWEIPRGDRTEYGIMAKPSDAKKFLDKFCQQERLVLEDIRASVVPHGFAIPKNQIVTLCGDAAGLTKPWSGGGIAWGLIAANMLLETFPDFEAYQRKAKKFFKPKIIFSQLLTDIGYLAAIKFPWLLPNKFNIRGDFLK